MAYITIYDTTQTDRSQLQEQFAATDHHVVYVEEAISLDNLHQDSEMISVFVSSKVTKEIIEQLPKLKVIACRSTGYNHIDLAAAADSGVTVINVPSYGEKTVAEYTFAMLLNVSRRISAATASIFAYDFDQEKLVGFDLHGKTLGIIGSGRIGQSTAQIAKGFGMEVIAYDPYPNNDKAAEVGFSYVSLMELAEQSDVVSLHSPYTGSNRHLINTDFLRHIKPSAILLNTARGELVDTQALITALKEKRLAGAALDVIEGEQLLQIDEEMLLLRRAPAAPDILAESLYINILKRLPNVLITPHNAFNTIEAIGRINETSAGDMIKYWYGETPNKVQPPVKQVGQLLLVRHGESEWNALGKWTGTTDVHLSEKGFHEAALLGLAIKDIHFDFAVVSQQIRAYETMQGILDSAQQFDAPYERSADLNERDYGDYTGLNKWEVQDKIGEETFQRLRRDWDYPVPNGETLKMVYERAVPFYRQVILPKLLSGQNVLVVSHGNALRALIKYIENISDDDIANVDMPFGNILLYRVDTDGHIAEKEERFIDTTPPPA